MRITNVSSAAAEMPSMIEIQRRAGYTCHQLQHIATPRHSAELPGAQDGVGIEEGKLKLRSCLD